MPTKSSCVVPVNSSGKCSAFKKAQHRYDIFLCMCNIVILCPNSANFFCDCHLMTVSKYSTIYCAYSYIMLCRKNRVLARKFDGGGTGRFIFRVNKWE